MKASLAGILALAGIFVGASTAFCPPPTGSRTAGVLLTARRRNGRSSDEPREDDRPIPQLPFGSSSGGGGSPSSVHVSQQWTDAALVDRKLDLQYTCKVCETRNTHKVSRIAYNKGVVICVCKGCMSQHLISDHLGFTNLQFDGTVEDYFSRNKSDEEKVHRVSGDVFHLEKILGVDTKSGSIFGKDGNLHME